MTAVGWSTVPPIGWIQEIERRGIGQNRLLFATDEPWGVSPARLTRLQTAAGGGELGRTVLRDNSRLSTADLGTHPSPTSRTLE